MPDTLYREQLRGWRFRPCRQRNAEGFHTRLAKTAAGENGGWEGLGNFPADTPGVLSSGGAEAAA